MCNLEVCKSHLNCFLACIFNEGFVGVRPFAFRIQFESNVIICLSFLMKDYLFCLPKHTVVLAVWLFARNLILLSQTKELAREAVSLLPILFNSVAFIYW